LAKFHPKNAGAGSEQAFLGVATAAALYVIIVVDRHDALSRKSTEAAHAQQTEPGTDLFPTGCKRLHF
jgi:hypothetical protein